MSSHHALQDESALNKGTLVGSYQPSTNFEKPIVQDFRENLEAAIKEADWYKLLKIFSIRLLRD